MHRASEPESRPRYRPALQRPLLQWRWSGLAVFATLTGSHFVVDAYSSGYAPLLAVLRDRLGLSLAEMGGCAAMFAFSSSLMQPVYGYLSDRLSSRWLIALAPAVTAVGLGALPLTTNYAAALLAFFVVGIGIAAFHPQAVVQAREVGPGRSSTAVAFFFGGGHLGFAVGPILVGLVYTAWGWEGVWRVAIPGLLASCLLSALVPDPVRPPRQERGSATRELRRLWRPLVTLYLIVVVRGTIQLIYTGFLPVYFLELGIGFGSATNALSLFLGAGALGGISGGILADRIGGPAVLRLSMTAAGPLLLAAFLLPPIPQIALLSAGFFVIALTNAVTLVMAQDWIPGHRSTISSLMMGFAWGVGGVLAPAVGRLADSYGLRTALMLIAALPAFGMLLAWKARAAPTVVGSLGSAAAGTALASSDAAAGGLAATRTSPAADRLDRAEAEAGPGREAG